MIFFLLSLLLYSFLFIHSSSQITSKSINLKIILPFDTDKSQILENNNPIIQNFNNTIYTTIAIGNPPQTIKFYLKSDTDELLIKSYDIKMSETKKRTYIKGNLVYMDSFYLSICPNNELFEFQNITFIKTDKDNINNIIGLGISKNDDNNFLISQLIDLNYAKDSSFMLKYFSEENGNLYISDLPNKEIFKNYNSKNYKKTNAVISRNDLSWDLIFSDIEYDGNKINKNREVNLDFNFGLFSCTEEYFSSIIKSFFNEYIKNDICQIMVFNDNFNNFNYIECVEEKFNYKKFPEIIFWHRELNYKFILEKEDLFLSANNKIYFKIILDYKNKDYWKFGKSFFIKYNIIFSNKLGTIGFYFDENKFNWGIIEWIIIVILFLFLAALCRILIKRYRINSMNKKLREFKGKELNEAIYYEQRDQNYINKI